MEKDEDEIEKKFKAVLNLLPEFYRGSDKLSIAKINAIQITSKEEGKYFNDYNYKIEGFAEFYVNQIEGDQTSNGVEGFEVLLKIKGKEIEAIDRVNIENHK